MDSLGERLQKLRKERKLSQTELSNALNAQFDMHTDRVMISKWETGFQFPMMSAATRIAKFFDVSLDYLNGDSNSRVEKTDITEREMNLIENFRALNEEGQEKMLDYADDLVQSEKYKKHCQNSVGEKKAV